MLLDKPKTIYLISQQVWDGFHVSKHHYATALARMGHRVYFIEPTVTTKLWGAIRVADTGIANLKVVHYSGYLHRWLRFRVRRLYDALGPLKVAQLVRAIGTSPDIVWDFDSHFQFAHLGLFKGAFRIFHPVDGLLNGWTANKGADVVFTLSEAFLDGIDRGATPTLLLPHGLNPVHEDYARGILRAPEDGLARPSGYRSAVGYVGNLDSPSIDWQTIQAMVERYPGVDFHFFGPYSVDGGRRHSPTVRALMASSNCSFHGLQSPQAILAQAHTIDVWLTCYDARINPNGAINSHKILEYLATGKSVLSNWVEAYDGTGLVEMPPSRNNADMVDMLGDILNDLPARNAPAAMVQRAGHAVRHGYAAHLAAADRFLTSLRAEAAGEDKAWQPKSARAY